MRFLLIGLAWLVLAIALVARKTLSELRPTGMRIEAQHHRATSTP